MPLIALVFALLSAVLHALWNLLLARAPQVEAATAVALVTAEVVFAPVAIVVWHVDSRAWPWLLGSGLLQLTYFTLLATAYVRAPLSVVYPIARGGAPVVVLVVSVLALGRTTTARQVAAVALIVLGIVLVRGVRRPDTAGLLFGVVIACCIGAYTLVDKHGIRYAGPIPYLELSMVLPTVAYASGVARAKGPAAVRAAVRPPVVLAGIATFAAYAFVLAALSRAPAASVAAVRETSVVVATALAAIVLKERVTRWRFLGACAVVAGIALIGA
jgi:uncharacterized membrane protein